MAYELKNMAILHAKDVDYRCIFWCISKMTDQNDAVDRLNNSVLEDKGAL